MRFWRRNLPASTFPNLEEHMNRIAKAVQPLLLVAIAFSGVFLGARAITPGVAAIKHTQAGIVLVDGPKACGTC
jgi:hypothetical protein